MVVVGAGIAGSATAMLLARSGWRVAIVAGDAPQGFPTAILGRAGVLRLAQWGLLPAAVDGVPPVTRVVYGTGDERTTISIKPALGVDALYAPDRDRLAATLLRTARDLGVDVRRGATVAGLLTASGRVAGVHLETPTHGRVELRGHVVIGADGPDSRLAALVGGRTLHRTRRPADTTFGSWTGVPADGFDWHFTPTAHAGLIPTGHGRVCVLLSGWSGGEPPTDPAALLAQLTRTAPALAALVRLGDPPPTVSRCRSVRGLVRSSAGPGWALVGSAGSCIDPATPYGRTGSLRDAGLLSAAVTAGLSGECPIDVALARYERARNLLCLPILAAVDRIREAGRGVAVTHLLQHLNSAIADECEAIAASGAPP